MYQKIIIYGAGSSGIESAKYLAQSGFQVALTDDDPAAVVRAGDVLQNATAGIKFIDNSQVAQELNSETAIILAPGVPLYFPKRHPIIDLARQKGSTLMCDIELFWLLNSGKKFIGITGTNGKSTSASLVDFIFNQVGVTSLLGGNIGEPVFKLAQDQTLRNAQNIVIEASSYQLDLMQKVRFDVAAFTNITPDHIDRHGNFENYIQSKLRILRNQGPGDFAIFNNDDKILREIFENSNFKANLIPFSLEFSLDGGVSIIDGILHNKIAESDVKFDIRSSFLRGSHNLENIALSFACVYCALLQNGPVSQDTQEKIISAIMQFQGLRHRMQILGTHGNITFVNDSKATNAISAQKSLQTFDDIFWILGGVSKENGLLGLENDLSAVKKAYLIGQSTQEFAKFLKKNDVKYEECFNLEDAFSKSYSDALNSGLRGANLLLSPACASFDQWKNFQERGDYFCKLFNEVAKK